ncbi:MAG TPA: aspartyl protease family protein [Terriglobia bacterium]|nr:aspartyl protease family protein [Terriglobia bacterium]
MMEFRAFCVVSVLMVFVAGVGAQSSTEELLNRCQAELDAAHYKNAVDSCQQVLKQAPARPEAVYGLVRALLSDRRSRDAYTAAAEGLESNPRSSSIQAAAGIVAFRKGLLTEAEKYFRAAIQLNPNDPAALSGLAEVYDIISRFKTAQDIRLRAYQALPTDPELMLAHARTLKREERIRVLEQVLALRDPATDEARRLRATIATLRALGDRTPGRLVSSYAPVQMKLVAIQNGLNHKRGDGLRVQFNGKETVTLLLDTGASGISVSPVTIQKAGLQLLGNESSDVRGIGNKEISSYNYLASKIKIGPVEFEDYPVTAFDTAKDSDVDGIIGADVFRDFIVTMDFPYQQIALTTRPNYQPGSQELSDAAAAPPAGFYRVYRFGDHIVIPTFVNGDKPSLFLMDTGASSSFIDTTLARETTEVSRDPRSTVRGVQGKVSEVSRARYVNLRFANLQENNSQLLAIDMDKMSDDMGVAIQGVLGMPILSKLRLTIDYVEGTVRFETPR